MHMCLWWMWYWWCREMIHMVLDCAVLVSDFTDTVIGFIDLEFIFPENRGIEWNISDVIRPDSRAWPAGCPYCSPLSLSGIPGVWSSSYRERFKGRQILVSTGLWYSSLLILSRSERDYFPFQHLCPPKMIEWTIKQSASALIWFSHAHESTA